MQALPSMQPERQTPWKKAADLIDSGAAEKTMEAYIQVSNE